MPLIKTKDKDLLIEIGTEELPAKGLEDLAKKFAAALNADQYYVTPRRLAVLIKNIPDKQPNAEIERKGPAVTTPKQAQEGFAKSCGVTLDQLTIKDGYLFHNHIQPGKKLADYIPALVEEALRKIPTGKTMRWGDHPDVFIRPIHWVLMIHGDKVIPGTVFGIKTGNITYGHRFHYPKPITIKNPAEYEKKLKDKKVIADFKSRRDIIIRSLPPCGGGSGWGESKLIDEITGLVEWPVILEGEFDKRFEKLPPEVLSTVMAYHQKCFPITGKNKFIIISNIESKNPKVVIQGNERVMRARLADAEFFYTTDCKRTLESRLENLKTIAFQAKLGSLYDKSVRVSKLAKLINNNPSTDKAAERAGLLCKADLATGMVGEFPELQGVMGGYYALNDKEDKHIAEALREHYVPMPTSIIGCAVALADRLDTLVGIFGINQQPTGDKDPFGLRRAAIGIINILTSQQWDLDLNVLLQKAVENYSDTLPNKNVVPEILKFILERMRANYIANGTNNSIVLAVEARGFSNPVDFHKRIQAVQKFSQLPQASNLAAANKRVSNILLKEKQDNIQGEPDPKLFQHPSEKALWEAILKKKDLVGNYAEKLTALADLQTPVDNFFTDVMVMVENEALRLNRLQLLNYLRQLFLEIADISLL